MVAFRACGVRKQSRRHLDPGPPLLLPLTLMMAWRRGEVTPPPLCPSQSLCHQYILQLPFVIVSSTNPFSICTRYGDTAAASGSRIASAAGYDSVPGDFGTVLAQQEVRRGLRSPPLTIVPAPAAVTPLSAPLGSFGASLPQFRPPSVPSSVDAYLSVCPGPLGYSAHYATWQSAVLGFASVPALRALRAARAAGRPEGGAAPLPPPRPQGPKPLPPSGIEYIKHPAVRSFSVPFPGDDDGA